MNERKNTPVDKAMLTEAPSLIYIPGPDPERGQPRYAGVGGSHKARNLTNHADMQH